MFMHLCLFCECFCSTAVELGSCSETQRSFTEKFANLCVAKYFDKHHFHGIILTVSNIGKVDNLSILQIRKGFV